MNNYGFIRGARDVAGMVAVVCRYYLLISWRARRQLRRWHRRAERIADPELRALALEKLRGESLHAQAAAVFATTAPCRSYGPLVELQVGIAVMFDFLDGVSEAAVPDQLANGKHLFRAMDAALDPGAKPTDYYAAYTLGEGDGGYLDDLAAACCSALDRLPRAEVVRPLALEAAKRCSVGQTRTHSAETNGINQLREWAETLQPQGRDYAWWELGAGAAATLALHALLAAAADPATTSAQARRLDAAYFPSVCALATLLDSLIDYDGDQITGAHSFVSYYGQPEVAAERLAGIATDGVEAVAGIGRRTRQHIVIATGVVAFYLSSASAHGLFAGVATRRVIGAMNPFVLRPILAITAAKRRI